ncbi:MAG: hypothetical protein KAR19_04030 [Bacteroidales bacterium]|nr:hypothetical protein [Bacteroidales bacterium]
MRNVMYIFMIAIVLNAWSCAKTTCDDSLINTSHLEHLYQEIDINDHIRLGTVWIYSNAPDYPLVNDPDEGFTCVDDVSRALVFYCRQYKRDPVKKYLDKIESLTRFIMYMKAGNGYYNNFMFPDNGINVVHPNSRSTPNFWSWRAFWALTELNLLDSPELNDLRVQTQPYLEQLFNNIEQLFSAESDTIEIAGIKIPSVLAEYGADQVAVIMIALSNYYQINNQTVIKGLLLKLGDYLLAAQYGGENRSPYFAFLSWKNIWHAWGNMQAYALLYTGRIIQNVHFINAGLNEVKYFYPFCIEQNFLSDFKVASSNDSIFIYNLHSFPQISYGIRPMIFASLEAYHITGDEVYATLAGTLTTWYFGNNPAHQVMYDHLTGRAFDGIDSASKTNYNSGAESTIETLLSIQAMESNAIAKRIVMEHI